VSTAYIDSLLNHIELLQHRLKDTEGKARPQEGSSTIPFGALGIVNSDFQQQGNFGASNPQMVPGDDGLRLPAGEFNHHPDVAVVDLDAMSEPLTGAAPSNRSSSFSRDARQSLQGMGNPHKLLLPEGPDILDALRGKPESWAPCGQEIRKGIYLGPLAGLQQYVNQLDGCQRTVQISWNLHKRTDRLLEELDRNTHDHLMELFWSNYNSIFNLVDRDLFWKHKTDGGPHYSRFLHICCLAMGFRFADKDQADVQPLDMGNLHSTFHKSAKYLFEAELEYPSGTSTIQAFLILSDLECAVSRDRLGWMYCSKFQPLFFSLEIRCRTGPTFGRTTSDVRTGTDS
jgi:Fungal specific transcription factor domain